MPTNLSPPPGSAKGLDPRNVKYIIVHSTGTSPNTALTYETLDRLQRARGWRSFGYHYFIARSGGLRSGRRLDEIGAHCQGYDDRSIGIVLVGGLDPITDCAADNYTPAQKRKLYALLSALHEQFPKAEMRGTRDMSGHANKGSPGFDVRGWLADLPPFAKITKGD